MNLIGLLYLFLACYGAFSTYRVLRFNELWWYYPNLRYRKSGGFSSFICKVIGVICIPIVLFLFYLSFIVLFGKDQPLRLTICYQAGVIPRLSFHRLFLRRNSMDIHDKYCQGENGDFPLPPSAFKLYIIPYRTIYLRRQRKRKWYWGENGPFEHARRRVDTAFAGAVLLPLAFVVSFSPSWNFDLFYSFKGLH